MSDSADTTFKINDLLVSILPAGDAEIIPTQIMSGTIVTNAVVYWPAGGGLLCGSDGAVASPGSDSVDPPLLAGVKALLRAQIAQLEDQPGAPSSTPLVPTTPEQAAVLESKLLAALDTVRRVKAGLEEHRAE